MSRIDYRKQSDPYRIQVEDLGVALYDTKEEFAAAIEMADYKRANELTQKIRKIITKIVLAFRYDFRTKFFGNPKNEVKDFRLDTRLRKLVTHMTRLNSYLKEDAEQVNLGRFACHVDMATDQVWKILERVDDITKSGVDQTPIPRKRVTQSLILRENFESWQQWTSQEIEDGENGEIGEHFSDPSREDGSSDLDQIDKMLEDLVQIREEKKGSN